MESGNCNYPPVVGLFDELPWMPMPQAYYSYPISSNGQPRYPIAMQHQLHYPNAANWYGYNAGALQTGGKYKKKRNLFTKLQLNMLQRRFAEKEHIRQPERDNFAQMIGLTGEQVKIWFQNQRYKRKHRCHPINNANATCSSGADTSVSSISSPSPTDSPQQNLENISRQAPKLQEFPAHGTASDPLFHQTQRYSQMHWESQMTYYHPPNFATQACRSAPEEKLFLAAPSENDLRL